MDMCESNDSRFRAGHVSTDKSMLNRVDDIFALDGPHIGIRDSCSIEEIIIKTPMAAKEVFMLERLLSDSPKHKKATYLMNSVETTPIATAALTMIRGRPMMEALASTGK